MLTVTRTKPPKTTLYSYLHTPSVNTYSWFSRNRGEQQVILCDMEILLTEELRTYLLYFFFTMGRNINPILASFSEIPIKEELC